MCFSACDDLCVTVKCFELALLKRTVSVLVRALFSPELDPKLRTKHGNGGSVTGSKHSSVLNGRTKAAAQYMYMTVLEQFKNTAHIIFVAVLFFFKNIVLCYLSKM